MFKEIPTRQKGEHEIESIVLFLVKNPVKLTNAESTFCNRTIANIFVRFFAIFYEMLGLFGRTFWCFQFFQKTNEKCLPK